MNMQDYKNAVDRIVIDPECRKEILQIGAGTAERVRKPFLRLSHSTAGIAIAAALLVLNGALCYTMLSTRDAVESSRAGLSSEEPNYSELFRAYYNARVEAMNLPECRADFTGWGADCGQVLETDTCRRTVEGLLFDGFQYQVIYSTEYKGLYRIILPYNVWPHMMITASSDTEQVKNMVEPNDMDALREYVKSNPLSSYEDTAALTNGRMISLASVLGVPLNENVLYALAYDEKEPKNSENYEYSYTEMQAIPVPAPAQMPETVMLSEPVEILGHAYSYAAVTPLSVVLSDAPLAERQAAMQEGFTRVNSHRICMDCNEQPEVYMLTADGVPQQLSCSYYHGQYAGDYSTVYTVQTKDGREINTCYLDYMVPQTVSEIRAMLVNGCVIPLHASDDAAALMESFAGAPYASNENLLADYPEEIRSREYEFGTLTIDALRPCGTGCRLDYSVAWKENFYPETKSGYGYDSLGLQLRVIGRDENGREYRLDHKSGIPYCTGRAWDGKYHFSVMLGVEDVSAGLNMEMHIFLQSAELEGYVPEKDEYTEKYYYEAEERDFVYDTNEIMMFAYGFPAYYGSFGLIPENGGNSVSLEGTTDSVPENIRHFNELSEEERMREFSCGTVRIDGLSKDSEGKIWLDYSYHMAWDGKPDFIVCQLLVTGYTRELEFVDLTGDQVLGDALEPGEPDDGMSRCIATAPDAEGWWHYRMQINAVQKELPDNLRVLAQLMYAQIGSTPQEVRPEDDDGQSDEELYRICWFRLNQDDL